MPALMHLVVVMVIVDAIRAATEMHTSPVQARSPSSPPDRNSERGLAPPLATYHCNRALNKRDVQRDEACPLTLFIGACDSNDKVNADISAARGRCEQYITAESALAAVSAWSDDFFACPAPIGGTEGRGTATQRIAELTAIALITGINPSDVGLAPPPAAARPYFTALTAIFGSHASTMLVPFSQQSEPTLHTETASPTAFSDALSQMHALLDTPTTTSNRLSLLERADNLAVLAGSEPVSPTLRRVAPQSTYAFDGTTQPPDGKIALNKRPCRAEDVFGPEIRKYHFQTAATPAQTVGLAGCVGLLDATQLELGDTGATVLAEALQTGGKGVTELLLGSNGISVNGTKAIIQALASPAVDAVELLDLSRNALGDAGAISIAELLDSTAAPMLSRIRLGSNQISDIGAMAIGLGLEQNDKVTEIWLDGNNVGPIGASDLFKAVGSTSSRIDNLVLFGNPIGAHASMGDLAFRSLAGSRLISLDLSDCSINDAGATDLAAWIATNTRLQQLLLRRNVVGAKGAESLGHALATNVGLKMLDMEANPIGSNGATAIGIGLDRNAALQRLSLKGCELDKQAGIGLAAGLRTNKALKQLVLANNGGLGSAGIAAIADAIAETSKIGGSGFRVLDFSSCNAGDVGALSLGAGFFGANGGAPNLDTLILKHNGIGPSGAAALATGLGQDISVRVLDLEANTLGDAGVVSIAKALTTNTQLRELNLKSNQVTDAGARSLGQALRRNRGLMELDIGGRNRIIESTVEAIDQFISRNRFSPLPKTLPVSTLAPITQDSPQIPQVAVSSAPSSAVPVRTFAQICEAAGIVHMAVLEANSFKFTGPDAQYNANGNDPGTVPIVIRHAGAKMPAVIKWKDRKYLRNAFQRAKIAPLTRFMPVGSTFIRGTDIDLEVPDSDLRVFGPPPADGGSIYTGAADLSGIPELLADLTPLPPFMQRSSLPDDSTAFSDETMKSMIWASNGDVDSGLHFDRNKGGFLLQVTGRKEIIMFSPADCENLYPRPESEHESTLYMVRDLVASNRDVYPKLWNATPYTVSLSPGDALYIPHGWWHEVYTIGTSVAYSAWVQPPPRQITNEDVYVVSARQGLEPRDASPNGLGVVASSGSQQCSTSSVFMASKVTSTGFDFSHADLRGCSGQLQILGYSQSDRIGNRGAIALASALSVPGHQITSLLLRGNNISSDGAVALATALQTPAAKGIIAIDLSHNQLGDTGAIAFAELLDGTKAENGTGLTRLLLGSNQIGDVGAVALGLGLTGNMRLAEIGLSNNNIGPVGAADLFGAIGANGSAVRVVVLSNNPIGGNGAAALGSILAMPDCILAQVDLSYCEVDDAGATGLAAGLERNRYLRSLILSENVIGTEGSKAIGVALATNAGLESLILDNNPIGSVGATAVGAGLNANIGLQRISLKGCKLDSLAAVGFSLGLKGSSSLKHLLLANNPEMGGPGVAAIAAAVGENMESSLVVVDLQGCRGGNSGAKGWAAALSGGSTAANRVVVLNLSDNGIDDIGADVLAAKLTEAKSLRELDLGSNAITTAGAIKLGNLAAKGIRLERINLRSGTNSGAGDISDAVLAAIDKLLLNSQRRLD